MTMQHDQSAQALVMQCDSCPEAFDTEHIAWEPAMAAAKAEGWRAYIGPDKKWAHSCPACTEDFAKRQRR